jgi:hypothetical protein
MPTGLTDSPALIGETNSMFVRLPQAAINTSIQVIFAATGVPQPLPGIRVPVQATVRIRAHNGTNAGNAAPCRAALYREALTGTGGDVMTPDTEIIYPLDNTAQVWVVGTAGDGVLCSIRANATQ